MSSRETGSGYSVDSIKFSATLKQGKLIITETRTEKLGKDKQVFTQNDEYELETIAGSVQELLRKKVSSWYEQDEN